MTQDLGAITAYAEAVAGGYTGTKEQFEAQLAEVPDKAKRKVPATTGNLATLDANGDLGDSGKTIEEMQTKLTFDTAPTADSTNPVTSGGVHTALGNKQAKVTATGILKGDGVGGVSVADAAALKALLDTLSAVTPATADKIPLTSGDAAGYTTIASLLALVPARAQIATGSYVGTGLDSLSITFPFKPTLFFIYGLMAVARGTAVIPGSATEYTLFANGTNDQVDIAAISWAGNTVTFQTRYDNHEQEICNRAGETYVYILLV